jgi:hypothetical protein
VNGGGTFTDGNKQIVGSWVQASPGRRNRTSPLLMFLALQKRVRMQMHNGRYWHLSDRPASRNHGRSWRGMGDMTRTGAIGRS